MNFNFYIIDVYLSLFKLLELKNYVVNFIDYS